MSEQQKPKSFMQELDQWTDVNVVDLLLKPHVFEDDLPRYEGDVAMVKKAIREKVLESYRNGQASKPTGKGRR